jgi:cell division septum initiation protein DivIVA
MKLPDGTEVLLVEESYYDGIVEDVEMLQRTIERKQKVIEKLKEEIETFKD